MQDLYQCSEYNGKVGCCTTTNDIKFNASYLTIDTVFGSAGGGCDICAVNLKRLWCEYTCSPRQN